MFGNLVGVAINVVFLSYIRKLEIENCECSEDKLRNYIKKFSGAMVGLFLLNFLLAVLSIKVFVPRVFRVVVSLLILAAGIYQVYALFKYSHKLILSKPECECSKDWRRTFMFYMSIFYAFLLAILTIQVIYISVKLALMSKSEKKQLMNTVKAMKKARNNSLRASSKSGSRK